jgi:hypothetical protein
VLSEETGRAKEELDFGPDIIAASLEAYLSLEPSHFRCKLRAS